MSYLLKLSFVIIDKHVAASNDTYNRLDMGLAVDYLSFWLNLWRDFASMLIDKLHQAENYVTISKQKIHISLYMGLSLIKMICLLRWLTCWYENLTPRFISLVSEGWMAANMPISLITCLCAIGVIIVCSYFHMTEVI